jgi:hypothetical protein
MSTRSPLTCYKSRCGHDTCRAAWNAYSRDRTRQKAYGLIDEGWADAEPVRQHVRALGAAGMGEVQVAAASGVTEGALRTLLRGDKQKGTAPTKRMRSWRAEALLAVQPEVSLFADGARVDATGTRRRLQALAAIGWPTGQLGPILNRDTRVIARTRSAEFVTARTAREVKAAYDRLWDQTPPMETWGDRNAAARARNLAARNGWAKPMDWDDIDDPNAKPYRARGHAPVTVDPVAVERALKGDEVRLNPAEVNEVVRIGEERGWSAARIASVADRSERSIQRRRAR